MEEDYHDFWRILHPHLPGPYEEWLVIHRQEAQNLLMVGHSSTGIRVNPAEFARYCRAKDKAYDPAALGEFAKEKARGMNY
jgi:hypothetical protein